MHSIRTILLCWVTAVAAAPVGDGSSSLVSKWRRPIGHGYPYIWQRIKGWTELDCYKDVDATERLLPFQPRFEQTEPDRTVEGCANACADHGYCFAGLENGRECWCGMHEPLNSLRGGFCNAPCSGDFDQICGGAASLLVYSADYEFFPECYVGMKNASSTDSPSSMEAIQKNIPREDTAEGQPVQGLGLISKIVAKIKEMVSTMFGRVSADVATAKKTVEGFLGHFKLAEEIEQEMAAQGLETNGPFPKIGEKILLKKMKKLMGTMFERVQADIASGKTTAQAFLEHLPGGNDKLEDMD